MLCTFHFTSIVTCQDDHGWLFRTAESAGDKGAQCRDWDYEALELTMDIAPRNAADDRGRTPTGGP
jgi:hypothetical protein